MSVNMNTLILYIYLLFSNSAAQYSLLQHFHPRGYETEDNRHDTGLGFTARQNGNTTSTQLPFAEFGSILDA